MEQIYLVSGKSDSVYDCLGYSSNKKYICAGVLMMNINYWRKANILEKVLDYGKTYLDKTLLPDIDAINVICQEAKVIIWGNVSYGFWKCQMKFLIKKLLYRL